MRLITHTDLDGVACAVLISSVEQVDIFKFVDPGTIQAGLLKMGKQDILSDLPFDSRVGMWFDHHESNKPREGVKFEGAFRVAPSAARVVYEYYENPYLEKFAQMVEETDKIDSGQVEIGMVENPSGWFLLSNTLESSAPKAEDDRYKEYVINLIKRTPGIDAILSDAKVSERASRVLDEFAKFKEILLAHTVMIGKVAFSDLRERPDLPKGNNFVVYSLFPQAVTSVRIMPQKEDKNIVKVSVGHNIYGKKCEFDVGAAMKRIGGGGHRAVGGATVKSDEAEKLAHVIIDEINRYCEGEGL